MDDKIIAMYAPHITKREVRGSLLESCGVKGPEFISSVTGVAMAEVGAWLVQPLEPMDGGISSAHCPVKIGETRSCATIGI